MGTSVAMAEADDNKAELLDEDVIGAEYPPDEPMAVDERLTAIEEQSGESFGHRVTREDDRDDLSEPDLGSVGTLVAPGGDQWVDDEDTEVADEVRDLGDAGWETATQDREEVQSAEEAAMHLTEPPPMGDGDGYLLDDEER
jgi:hypothetical protein